MSCIVILSGRILAFLQPHYVMILAKNPHIVKLLSVSVLCLWSICLYCSGNYLLPPGQSLQINVLGMLV